MPRIKGQHGPLRARSVRSADIDHKPDGILQPEGVERDRTAQIQHNARFVVAVLGQPGCRQESVVDFELSALDQCFCHPTAKQIYVESVRPLESVVLECGLAVHLQDYPCAVRVAVVANLGNRGDTSRSVVPGMVDDLARRVFFIGEGRDPGSGRRGLGSGAGRLALGTARRAWPAPDLDDHCAGLLNVFAVRVFAS